MGIAIASAIFKINSSTGYINSLFILSWRILINYWVQVGSIKGLQQDFDIILDARAHIFLPKKTDNQHYQQEDPFSRDTISPPILLMLMKDLLVLLLKPYTAA